MQKGILNPAGLVWVMSVVLMARSFKQSASVCNGKKWKRLNNAVQSSSGSMTVI
ncbi:MAG: hypothetical protein ABSH38_18610 [Verrucomicrobiota bacterium]|jgi:hypothetical protein